MAQLSPNLQLHAEQLLEELGLHNLSNDERQTAGAELLDHFNTLIIETAISNMDEDQLDAFQSAMKMQSPQREETISTITSQIPGLTTKIQDAVASEIQIIKTTYDKIK